MSALNRHTDEVGRKSFDALIEYMKSMPIDKITVSAILSRAKVSRSSFYRRYRDKYDLLNQSYELILKDTLYPVIKGASYRKAFLSLYSVLHEYPDFFKNAFLSTEHNCLKAYIFERSMEVYTEMFEQNGLDPHDSYYQMMLYGFITGSLEVTVQWALHGMKESVEEIFKLCYEMMPGDIKSLVSLYYM